jgi:hypothetical protein
MGAGALSGTYEAITDKGEISVGVQRMIRNPGLRTDAQRERGRVHMSQMRAERKRRDAPGSRSKAVNAFLAKVRTKESPPGSNGGGLITAMEAFWGFGRVAWCGIAAGYYAGEVRRRPGHALRCRLGQGDRGPRAGRTLAIGILGEQIVGRCPQVGHRVLLLSIAIQQVAHPHDASGSSRWDCSSPTSRTTDERGGCRVQRG